MRASKFLGDVAIRAIVLTIGACLELVVPFQRVIQAEEVWLYRNPSMSNYVPFGLVIAAAVVVPIVTQVAVLSAIRAKDRYFVFSDVKANFMSSSLAVAFTYFTTNVLKIVVGRPRPDFMFRCWPVTGQPTSPSAFNVFADGHQALGCTGDGWDLAKGRKSFPSGHTSVIFATFISSMLYAAGKLHTFHEYKSSSCKAVLSLLFMLVPTLVGISRTCDYHHHWQDVVVGASIGISMSWMCYRAYYPHPSLDSSHLPKEFVLRSCATRNPNDEDAEPSSQMFLINP